MNKIFQSMYTAAVKGLYRSNTNLISEECFGDWIADNMTQFGKMFENLANGTIPTFEEAK